MLYEVITRRGPAAAGRGEGAAAEPPTAAHRIRDRYRDCCDRGRRGGRSGAPGTPGGNT